MKYRLSNEKISSFRGDVIPLRLISNGMAFKEKIKWGSDNPEIVIIREFSGEDEDCFDDGVLLILIGKGDALVWAETEGERYYCPLHSREARKANPFDKMNYYIGDFHSHTTSSHDKKTFCEETENLSLKCSSQVKKEGLLDFFVLSDHASLLDRRKYFEAHEAAESLHDENFIPFAGAESEITIIEHDFYGVPHKNSGEVVTVNSAGFVNSNDWDSFYAETEESPAAIGSLAHPQILGYSTPGIWNFSLFKKGTDKMKNIIHLVEMGNGGDRNQNLLHEYTYSEALDCGFRIAPVCTSDSHGPVWGYNAFPGKTIIMAPEKSKEMFLDALKNARVYASESGNVKLYYTVNGYPASSTMVPAEEYKFFIHISYFKPPGKERIIGLGVISDYGRTVKAVENITGSSLEFTVKSPSSRYFYLRLHGADGSKTWSAPVWTGRPFDKYIDPESYSTRLDKREFKAVDLLTDRTADELLSENPYDIWMSHIPEAEIEIDMGREYEICALGYYPHPLSSSDRSDPLLMSGANFISEYEIYAAVDRNSYVKCTDGIIRSFGGEQIITFSRIRAKYVKFKVISTVGRASGKIKYRNAPVYIGELNIFA
jgi:hypothetical protein